MSPGIKKEESNGPAEKPGSPKGINQLFANIDAQQQASVEKLKKELASNGQNPIVSEPS